MKRITILSFIALVAIVVSSCGSSNNVVSNHTISKRKYNKGFFFNRNANFKSDEAKAKEVDLKEDKTVAEAERVEARKAKKAEKEMAREVNVAAADLEFSPSFDSNPMQEAQITPQPSILKDEVNDLEWSVTPNNAPSTSEAVEQMESTRTVAQNKQSKNSRRGESGAMLVLLVILALIIPPLAVFIYEGATTRFWIDLILAVVGIGIGIGLSGLAYLAALAAVIYALLIVLGVI